MHNLIGTDINYATKYLDEKNKKYTIVRKVTFSGKKNTVVSIDDASKVLTLYVSSFRVASIFVVLIFLALVGSITSVTYSHYKKADDIEKVNNTTKEQNVIKRKTNSDEKTENKNIDTNSNSDTSLSTDQTTSESTGNSIYNAARRTISNIVASATNQETQSSQKETTYRINYILNGGHFFGNPYSSNSNSEVVIAPAEKTGYEFVKWVDENGKAVTKIGTGRTKDITLTAVFKPIKYTITYELFGGVASNQEEYTVEDEVVFNNPERVGYTFKNYVDEKGREITSIPVGSVGNRTITAKYTADTHKVKFYINKPTATTYLGTGNMADFNVTYGQDYLLPKNEFRVSNFSFKGWSLTPNGEVVYQDKGQISNLTEDIELYAQWYSVAYFSNTGMKSIRRDAGNNSDQTDQLKKIVMSDTPITSGMSIADTGSAPIYKRYDSTTGTMYLYTSADKIIVSDAKNLFSGFRNIEEIDFSIFDFSEVTDFTEFLRYSIIPAGTDFSKINADITNLDRAFYVATINDVKDLDTIDFSHVVSMDNTFYYAEMGDIDISGWNLEKLESMNSTFYDCKTTNIKAVDMYMPNLREMNATFGINSSSGAHRNRIEVDIDVPKLEETDWVFSGFDGTYIDVKMKAPSLKSLTRMFALVRASKIDNIDIDTSNVINMSAMFYDSSLDEIDISKLDTRNVTDMSQMFTRCPNLRHIYVGPNWSTDKVNNSSSMFTRTPNLPNFSTSYLDKTKAYVGEGGYLEYKQ